MFNHNWLMLPLPALIYLWLWVFCCSSGIYGQSENAIGAHRAYQKTSFSCTGRPSGYYADIETGCQVYHMCDGLGRQFSYSCPNTTLFQQRMLICDHWYMVNCSRAESDYAANLLIGQRDKPFVNDDENHLRTPRPDLLDRPYAPDYSGESYRNQYKQLPAFQNQIKDTDAQKNLDKTAATAAPSQLAPGQQRWKIPPPSRTILPPAYEPQIEVTADESSKSDLGKKQTTSNVRFVATTRKATPTTRYTTTTTTRRPTTTTTTTTTRRPTAATTKKRAQQQYNFSFNNAALHQRQHQQQNEQHDDLGTSHSTRYNTSADFQNSAEAVPTQKSPQISSFNTRKSSTTTVTTLVPLKVPSKIYEPPHLYPIYNENDTTTYSTEKPLRVSSATPFTASSIVRYTAPTTTTTIRPPSRPTTLAGKPFTLASTAGAPPLSSVGRNQNNLVVNRFDIQKASSSNSSNRKEPPRTPTPAQGFKAPTPLPPVFKPSSQVQKVEASALDYSIPTSGGRLNLPTPIIGGSLSTNAVSSGSALPATDLLPPFQEFVIHDDATTQGPPIYYEWKMPSNGLEPPKLDAPIGVDGREYPESVADYNSASDSRTNGQSSSSSTSTFSSSSSANRSSFSISSNNPFLPVLKPSQSADAASITRTPTSRSIKDTAQPNSITSTKGSSTRTNKSATGGAVAIVPTAPSDIISIRKELSVPEYAFPLEQIGRTGYLSADTYNSFQLKYPERHGAHDNDAHTHWFGENPKCPECHPSYVVPGTCEPCLRR